MKLIKSISVFILLSSLVSCDFLDPLPDGTYNNENFSEHGKLLRGYVDKIYNDFLPMQYATDYLLGISAATDDAMYRVETSAWRKYSNGTALMSNNPFTAKWNTNYKAIHYANLFLVDNIGLNTRYLLDIEADKVYRRTMQGSAYGLRAYFYFDLLRAFAGIGTDGNMLGVPLILKPTDTDNMDYSSIRRESLDDCVKQILDDCDSAYVYLPYSNKDYPGDPEQSFIVTGSVRYKTLDQVCIDALRALVYLYWASPAFNPEKDMTRYYKAAEYAAKVMGHKLEVESMLSGGFEPLKKFAWHEVNSQEIVWPSEFTEATDTEKCCYPPGFGGQANIVPTQNIVDAFPMKNGYPITDERSGYDASNPYKDRDPRFYSAIYYNGAKVLRLSDSNTMYTFNTAEYGQDAPGGTKTSPTGYYIKKFLYRGWNPYDAAVSKGYRCVHLLSWTQMCLAFAEAANECVGPNDKSTFGYSAKQALAWLRSRSTNDGLDGLGKLYDPYLDECSGDRTKFSELVRNEWRVETCFEGDRYYNVRRWAEDVGDLNIPLRGVNITSDMDYRETVVEQLNYPSLWSPLPYMDIRRCPNLVQNQGWESWR